MTRRLGPYAPLSATYYSDDVIIQAGEAAELLFVRGLAFCATSNSDGYITEAQLDRVVGAGMRDAGKRAAKLVEVGAWERAPGGFQIRSWIKWNRSTSELGQAKKKDRERKAAITSELRREIHERDGWSCRYCGAREDLCVDHIRPQARGGDHEPGNLQTLCQSCNFRKGTRDFTGMTLSEVRALLDLPEPANSSGNGHRKGGLSSDGGHGNEPVSSGGDHWIPPPVPVSRASAREGAQAGALPNHFTSLQKTPPPPTPSASPEPDRPSAVAVINDGGGGDRQEVDAVLAAVAAAWHLPPAALTRDVAGVETALTAWPSDALVAHLAADPPSPMRAPFALVNRRLGVLPSGPDVCGCTGCTGRRSKPAIVKPPWCGSCDRDTRLIEDDDGRPRRCPNCHPLTGRDRHE